MEPQTSPFWSLPTAQVLGRLETGPKGLSTVEAALRLKQYAARRLAPKKRTDALTLLIRQFSSPIVLLLLGATTISLFLHDTTDAAIILAIVLAGGLLGFWQERGAAGAVEKLLSLVEVKAQVLRDGAPHDVPMADVVPGDVVVLSAGAADPGDCLLLEARALFGDEATLTGETFPAEKLVAVLAAETPLGKRTNAVFMGTHMVSGTATAVVVAIGRDTEFGAVADRLKLRPPETDFERGVRRFGYLLLEVTLLLVIGIFAFNVYLHRPVLDSFLFSIALAVGLTPQLLPRNCQHQPRPGGAPHGRPQGHRQAPRRYREFRQHERAVYRQDGDHHGRGGHAAVCHRPGRAGERWGTALRLPQRLVPDWLLKPHRRRDLQPLSYRHLGLEEAGRGALRFPAQAPLHPRRRSRRYRHDHQGRLGPGAGGVHHGRGRRGGRGAAGERAGADQHALRRVQRERPTHPGPGPQEARRRNSDRQEQ